eukprot:11186551-Lingulodinium_polyedra.AAC.1
MATREPEDPRADTIGDPVPKHFGMVTQTVLQPLPSIAPPRPSSTPPRVDVAVGCLCANCSSRRTARCPHHVRQ